MNLKYNEYIDCINRGNEYYSTGKYSESISFYEKALEIAIANNIDDYLPDTYTKLGNACDNSGIFAKAKENYQEVLKIALSTGNKDGECGCYINFAITCYHSNEHEESLGYLQKAERIALEIGNLSRLAETYLEYGNVYDELGKFHEAEEYLLKTFDIIILNIYNFEIIFLSALHKMISAVYFHMRDYEKSKCYLDIAEKLDRISKNENSLGITKMNIAGILVAERNYPKSIEYFEDALSIFKRLGNKLELGNCNLNLGATYSKLNDERAKEALENSLQIGKEISDFKLQALSYSELGRFYYSRDQSLSFEYLQYRPRHLTNLNEICYCF